MVQLIINETKRPAPVERSVPRLLAEPQIQRHTTRMAARETNPSSNTLAKSTVAGFDAAEALSTRNRSMFQVSITIFHEQEVLIYSGRRSVSIANDEDDERHHDGRRDD